MTRESVRGPSAHACFRPREAERGRAITRAMRSLGVSRSHGIATVRVSDDRVGGADPVRGSALRGLAARVEALNGRLDVGSVPGQGTCIRPRCPPER